MLQFGFTEPEQDQYDRREEQRQDGALGVLAEVIEDVD